MARNAPALRGWHRSVPMATSKVGALTGLGDTHSRWQMPSAGSANFMRLKPVSAGGRRRPIGGLNVGNSILLQANASIAPAHALQLFAHLLARECKSPCRATPDRLKATCQTAPGSRSRPRSGGALGRAGLDPAASADRKVSTTGSTSFNGALSRSDRSVCLAQVSDGLPADRRR
jgi:hypothetical protein